MSDHEQWVRVSSEGEGVKKTVHLIRNIHAPDFAYCGAKRSEGGSYAIPFRRATCEECKRIVLELRKKNRRVVG